MSQHFGDKGDATIFSHQAPKHQTMPTIKSLVKESRLNEALKALEKVVPDYLQNDVILQQSRLNGLEREENRGTISKENADIQRSRIRGAIMSIYDDAGIKEVEPEPVEETDEHSNNHTERDTGDGFGDQSEPIEIPTIEPFAESLIVPKGADNKTKILFLSANPVGQQNIAVEREAKLVKVESQGRDLNVVTCPHIDRRSMIDMVAFEQPQIVHFSGHGSNGGLALIDVETNRTASVSNEDLVRMFGLFKRTGVKCVVLCSCWSFNQAKSISELGIPVIGMLRKIGDEEAIQFSRDLYYLLVTNNPLDLIFELAKEKVTKASRDIPSLWYNGKRIA
jgi:Effector-associated domain 11/CHAT domain